MTLMENDYVFTKESYDIYCEIPAHLRDKFWVFFLQQRFIHKGEIIMFFMVRLWFEEESLPIKTSLSFSCEKLLEHIKINDGNLDMNQIFGNDTYVVYQCVKYPTKYNLELAEYLYSRYEDDPNYNRQFGTKWWNFEEQVAQIIYKVVGLVNWD